MRVTKAMIESLKAQYGLEGWTVRVRKKRGSSGDALGESVVHGRYKKATITLYPDKIRAERTEFEDETQLKVLHHEFAEVMLAGFEPLLPEAVTSSKAFYKYADVVADHVARMVGKK